MQKIKNILILFVQFLLIPLMAYAAGKAYAPSTNQQVMTIGGVKSDGTIVPLLVADDGTVQVECLP